MPFPRRSSLFVVVLAGCVCVPGCGGGDPGARRAPGDPIRVPDLGRPVGRPLSKVQPALIKKIRKSCGGRICVNVVVKHVYPELGQQVEEAPGASPGYAGYCQYFGLDPAPGTLIRPDSTIYIIAGVRDPRPCGVPDTVPAKPVTPVPPEAPEPTEEPSAPVEATSPAETPQPSEDTPSGPPEETRGPGPSPDRTRESESPEEAA
ncbi:hypothetical protein SAMN04489712_11526 [Thermomonospora echinospora]|uniref:Uncharacterized protein n=1 Tax=Thermomonospora echinospora TaxID=1992 RepID=A0A1H6DB39_9ACTN|nr:hypothetical protein [Thermomonospora echinospora]SEG82439.1 hypothetical protein SAMN04489712_11526 [Thermomonospora echinospora]